jgi:hypothetical protein
MIVEIDVVQPRSTCFPAILQPLAYFLSILDQLLMSASSPMNASVSSFAADPLQLSNHDSPERQRSR